MANVKVDYFAEQPYDQQLEILRRKMITFKSLSLTMHNLVRDYDREITELDEMLALLQNGYEAWIPETNTPEAHGRRERGLRPEKSKP